MGKKKKEDKDAKKIIRVNLVVLAKKNDYNLEELNKFDLRISAGNPFYKQIVEALIMKGLDDEPQRIIYEGEAVTVNLATPDMVRKAIFSWDSEQYLIFYREKDNENDPWKILSKSDLK